MIDRTQCHYQTIKFHEPAETGVISCLNPSEIICEQCKQPFCATHIRVCKDCGKPFCSAWNDFKCYEMHRCGKSEGEVQESIVKSLCSL